MMDFSIANEARKWSDAELAASIRTLADEQARRAAVPEGQRPNPRAVEIAKARYEKLYSK